MSDHKTMNTVKTTVQGKVLRMERILNAPRELVFKAFSDPKHLANWWGPKGWVTEVKSFDFKPNGVWFYCMKCVDKNQGDFYGQESCGKSIYQEIVEPEKIVLKDYFVDGEGNEMAGMPELLVTCEFLEHEGKTKLVSSTEFVSAEALQQVVDMGMEQGYSSQLERLDELLESLQ